MHQQLRVSYLPCHSFGWTPLEVLANQSNQLLTCLHVLPQSYAEWMARPLWLGRWLALITVYRMHPRQHRVNLDGSWITKATPVINYLSIYSWRGKIVEILENIRMCRERDLTSQPSPRTKAAPSPKFPSKLLGRGYMPCRLKLHLQCMAWYGISLSCVRQTETVLTASMWAAVTLRECLIIQDLASQYTAGLLLGLYTINITDSTLQLRQFWFRSVFLVTSVTSKIDRSPLSKNVLSARLHLGST